MAALVLAACATGPAPQAGFHDGAFRDPSRGIHAKLAPGWAFVPPERIPALRESGTEAVLERHPDLALSVARSSMRTRVLFMMFNAAEISTRNESIALLVETLPSSVVGMTTEAYALVARTMLQRVGSTVYDGEAPTSIEVSGSRFQAIHSMADMGSGAQYQSYYVHLHGREALTFIVTHDRRDRRDALTRIVQSVEIE